uniref:LRAT domain-containing protein n=1 Tax=Gadus morhua TaxID=8049 RepID=A0A8C4ZFL4_GADMO
SGVKPQPGDLIEIFRGSYQHWAVYIGDGLVNPGAGAYSMMSIVCDRARVTWAGFWDVVGTDEWRTNNILDDQCEPRSADLVVQEARRLVALCYRPALRQGPVSTGMIGGARCGRV